MRELGSIAGAWFLLGAGVGCLGGYELAAAGHGRLVALGVCAGALVLGRVVAFVGLRREKLPIDIRRPRT